MSVSQPDAGFFPKVYDELRRLAAAKMVQEPSGHTLDATALVHEAYLRLGDAQFASRSDFLRAAAVAMQRILVDHARRKKAAKRGGLARRQALEAVENAIAADPDTLLDLDEALGRLAEEDSLCSSLAQVRLFLGLSVEEAAEMLGLSRATAFREWAYARAWLTAALAATPRENLEMQDGSA